MVRAFLRRPRKGWHYGCSDPFRYGGRGWLCVFIDGWLGHSLLNETGRRFVLAASKFFCKRSNTMEKLFKLKAHGTDVKTEIRAGITTFFAMAYIIFVNSNYLSMTGMNKTGVMVATCISAAIGCLLTAFLANVPFCQAPGMGLNTFFTFTVCFGMGYTWEQALAIVFISGVLFLVVTVSPLRKKIIEAIPASLKAAISAGIGFFIALIGMFNVNIVTAFGTGIAGAYTDMGSITKGAALLALIGLAITAILVAYRDRKSVV